MPFKILNLDEYTGDGSVHFRGHPILKHNTGNWRACSLILGTEVCERLAYYGISKSLVTYLSTRLHQGNVSAARNFTTWQGTCYLTPLIGATLADSYWGKYRTIAVFSTIYFLGMAALTLSASVPSLQPPQCIGSFCPQANLQQYLIYFIGLYMIALGAGGIKPCVSSFGADQFDDTDPVERTKKGAFFNWFYFCISIGSLISGTVLIWVQENCGYSIGFGIPTFFIALAIGSFVLGSEIYRFQVPGGSPLTRACQVVVAAIRKQNVDLPVDSSLLYECHGKMSAIEGSGKLEHSSEFSFLDKSAVILLSEHGGCHNPWRLCTVTQIEELKILIRMFPIWATGIMFFTVYAQNSSMFIEQGMVLNNQVGSFKIPPATLSSLDTISVVVGIPIYERLIVPVARRLTGKERGFSELQRIGIGLFVSTIAVIVAALVEVKRLENARTEGLIHQNVPIPMSILWQAPQYLLVGIGEVFTSIGQAEFFYNQSPDSMRSLCSAFALLTVSLGSYLSSFILTLVSYFTTRGEQMGWIPDNLNEGHLDRFFWLVAGLSSLNCLAFIYFAQRYKCKKASVL
ncbi:protein NRT1/ PTR FAMILY 8.3 isoform X2 [Brachypodium distachyon]|uniref:protein NRT1/ PTR FAMILY 8.3 isoform X2 n=1 Tax=Brachypodium distachyon TaxID=15368 RepID=UPI00052FED56|nr:protein NRT1/ PTR FAMILY 8.3 isoform X2 [Brachypodium distachyon]|eukprot:XP_010228915.1 protein NRT1/ PTR FAMILY 8.3 isoform X2 [Brachypodium distachyon]